MSETMGDRIRNLKEERGLYQQELAERINEIAETNIKCVVNFGGIEMNILFRDIAILIHSYHYGVARFHRYPIVSFARKIPLEV